MFQVKKMNALTDSFVSTGKLCTKIKTKKNWKDHLKSISNARGGDED
jgi:hypothetical protein